MSNLLREFKSVHPVLGDPRMHPSCGSGTANFTLSRNEVSLKGILRQPFFLCLFLWLLQRRPRHPLVRRLALRPFRDGSASPRSLFRAFRHPRVGLLPLGPLRDGFSVFWLFAFFLVVLFQSDFLLALLVPLTQFGLSSSSSSVGCRCTFSRPLCGVRCPLLRVTVLFLLVFWAGCVALNTHIFLLPLLLPPPLLPPLLSRPLLLSRACCDALNTQSCSLALLLSFSFLCSLVFGFSFVSFLSPFLSLFAFLFLSFIFFLLSLSLLFSLSFFFVLPRALPLRPFRDGLLFFWLFTFRGVRRLRGLGRSFALFRVVALVGDPKPGSLVFIVSCLGFCPRIPNLGPFCFLWFLLALFRFLLGSSPVRGRVCAEFQIYPGIISEVIARGRGVQSGTTSNEAT